MLKAQWFNPYESDEQIGLLQWAAFKYPQETIWLFHPANGEKRDGKTAKRLEYMGVKSGVADLFLPHPIRPFHGLWIEMKRRHGSKLSDNQRRFLTDMANEGYCAAVAYGREQGERIIDAYLEGRIKKGDYIWNEPKGDGK